MPSASGRPDPLSADGFVDDLVEFFEKIGHVRGVAAFLQLLVDRLDVVVPLGECEGRGSISKSFEPCEDLAGP